MENTSTTTAPAPTAEPASSTAPVSGGQPEARKAANVTVRERARMHANRRQQTGESSSPPKQTAQSSKAESSAESPRKVETSTPSTDGHEGTSAEPKAPEKSASPSAEELLAPDTDNDAAPSSEGDGDDGGDPLAATAPTGSAVELAREILEQAKTMDGKSLQRDLIKRIVSLAEQRDKERAAREALEKAKPDQSPEPEPSSDAADLDTDQAFAGHPQIKPIDDKLSQLERDLNWAWENPHGGTVKDKDGNDIEVTEEQVARFRFKTENQYNTLSARRAARVDQLMTQLASQEQRNVAKAKEVYPWFNSPTSQEYKLAEQVLKQRPGLRSDPEWPLLLGHYVAGKMAFEARSKQNGKQSDEPKPTLAKPMTKPKGGNTPPSVVAASAGAAPKISAAQRALQEAQEEYRKTGSVKVKAKLSALRRMAAAEGVAA